MIERSIVLGEALDKPEVMSALICQSLSHTKKCHGVPKAFLMWKPGMLKTKRL